MTPETAPTGSSVETYPGIFVDPEAVYDAGPAQPQPKADDQESPLTDDPLAGEPSPQSPTPEESATPEKVEPAGGDEEKVEFTPFVIERGGLEEDIEAKSAEDVAKWFEAFENKEAWQRAYGTRERELATQRKQDQQYVEYGKDVASLPDEFQALVQLGLQGHPLANALKIHGALAGITAAPPEFIDDGYGNRIENPAFLKYQVQVLQQRLDGGQRKQQRQAAPVQSGDPDNPDAPPSNTPEFGVYMANKSALAEAIDEMAQRYGRGKADVKSREGAMNRILKGMDARGLNGVNAPITPRQYVALAFEADPKLEKRAEKLKELRKQNRERSKPRNNNGRSANGGGSGELRSYVDDVRL